MLITFSEILLMFARINISASTSLFSFLKAQTNHVHIFGIFLFFGDLGIFHKTSIPLGVLAMLLEDTIQCPGPKSVRGNWHLLPPVASKGAPMGPITIDNGTDDL